jgi:hypothetical protein
MAEQLILTTLRTKRASIERRIKAIEESLAQARHDLAHVYATYRLFELGEGDPDEPFRNGRYMGVSRLFGRRELLQTCREALEKAPNGVNTRELAILAIKSRGMDPNDKELRCAVVMSLINAMRYGARRDVYSDGSVTVRAFGSW